MHCPRGHKEMAVKRTKKNVLFRGVRLSIPVEQFVCPECGVEAGTVEQTAAIQKSITNAYRKSVGVLTGKEIFERRPSRAGLEKSTQRRDNSLYRFHRSDCLVTNK
jgi:hypothetical protein